MNLSEEKRCLTFLENIRWNGRPICPYCDSVRITSIQKEDRHRCNSCNTAFSVTARTVFHRTHLPLQKWFAAISIVLDARQPISARRLAQKIDVNKNTAWYLNTRIRVAMLEPTQRDLLLEIADLNETLIESKTSTRQAQGAKV